MTKSLSGFQRHYQSDLPYWGLFRLFLAHTVSAVDIILNHIVSPVLAWIMASVDTQRSSWLNQVVSICKVGLQSIYFVMQNFIACVVV